jgi:hypothetical protein
VRGPGGLAVVWRESELFTDLRRPQTGGACQSCSAYDSCRGGCMAAKFFTGLPLDGPDPECVRGHGEPALAAVAAGLAPRPSGDHSHRQAPRPAASRPVAPRPVPVTIGARPADGDLTDRLPPDRACDENPLAGFDPGRPPR